MSSCAPIVGQHWSFAQMIGRSLLFVALASALWLIPVDRVWATDAVFLLGQDAPRKPGYFNAAAAYYRMALPAARQISTLRSLAEVREYLVRHRGDEPWTRIVIVVHGSPWTGIQVPLYSGGPQANLGVIEDAAVLGEFPALPSDVLGRGASIIIESCGLGLRTDYLAAIGRLFAGNSVDAPVMAAAKGFLVFSTSGTGAALRVEQPVALRVLPGGLAQWSEARIAGEFAALVPERSGYQRHESRYPIRILVTYAGGRHWPQVRAERLAYADPVVRRQLRVLGLAPGALRWSVQVTGSDRSIRLVGEGLALLAYGQDKEMSSVLRQEDDRGASPVEILPSMANGDSGTPAPTEGRDAAGLN